MSEGQAVTIVVPVYGDWDSLKSCIESIKLHVDTSKHIVMLINDCGPDVELIERGIKSSIKGQKNIFYYRNDRNLGFIGTCNRAVLELEKTSNDILLLNSDTKVTDGFLDEMLVALYSAKEVGVVSPRSNNASIATIPLSAAIQKGIGADASYRLYKKMRSKLPRTVKVPVGHGFCMLIKRDLIKTFGLFDTVFGKGYGEEVDFCMRIRAAGYVCLLSNWSYVFHLEARSFSLETKAKLLEKNNQIIWKRYPNYRQSVRDYMDEALRNEGKIENSVGFNTPKSVKDLIKKVIKSDPRLHRLARMLRRLGK